MPQHLVYKFRDLTCQLHQGVLFQSSVLAIYIGIKQRTTSHTRMNLQGHEFR